VVRYRRNTGQEARIIALEGKGGKGKREKRENSQICFPYPKSLLMWGAVQGD